MSESLRFVQTIQIIIYYTFLKLWFPTRGMVTPGGGVWNCRGGPNFDHIIKLDRERAVNAEKSSYCLCLFEISANWPLFYRHLRKAVVMDWGGYGLGTPLKLLITTCKL